MVRTLKDTPPTSSAARFFESSVAERVLRHAETAALQPPPARPAGQLSHAYSWVKREFTLSTDADRAFTQFVSLLRDSTGTRLHNSHAMRALIHAVEPAFEAVRRELLASGPYRLPGNGKGDEGRRCEFERRLSAAIQVALSSHRLTG